MTQDLLLQDVGRPPVEAPKGVDRSYRIRQMHGVYGVGPDGAKCKTCARLIRRRWSSRVYLKCSLFVDSHGPATDWRAGYLACDKYEEESK